MSFYGIDFVAHELGVHPSSLRRWEENGFILPERATMGATTLRIYNQDLMGVLRRAKDLMDSGMSVVEAFAQAHDGVEHEEERSHD